MQLAIAALRHLFPAQATFEYQIRGHLIVEWRAPQVGSQGLRTQSVRIVIRESTLKMLEGIDLDSKLNAIEILCDAITEAMAGFVPDGGEFVIEA